MYGFYAKQTWADKAVASVFRELHGNEHLIEPEYVVFRSVRKQPLQRFDRKKLRTSFLEKEKSEPITDAI